MDMSPTPYVPIDLPSLAKRVNPTLAKIIPRFMYRRLERLLHIKEVNEFLEAHHDDDTRTFLDAVVSYLDLQIVMEGRGMEALHALEGERAVFASNHPYGGPEAIVLFSIVHRLFPDAKLVAQSFLKFIKPIETACVFNKKEVRTLLEASNNRNSLIFYPAGYCSRVLSNGEVFDYGWQPSFVRIARKNRMPILVIYTDGELSRKVHRWTRLRKLLRIKLSIESIFLVDEMFKLKGKTLRMVVGSTITPEMIDEAKMSDRLFADKLRQYCYELRKDPLLVFDPKIDSSLPQL
ncbi:MAG: hypothetical protein GX911_04445 [Spirochaetales bacterium]|nr:hypothetical protein [Spirochaetales bacterium]